VTTDRQTAIAARAHQIWEEAGHPHGQDAQHWQQAESEHDEALARAAAVEQFNAEPVEVAPAKPTRKRVAKVVEAVNEVPAAPPRKPTDHGEVVSFCLQFAATNSAILTKQSSGRSGWHMDLHPLANGIRRNVADALKAAAQHVDMFAENTARDCGRELTEEGVMPRPRQIRSRLLWDTDEPVLAFQSLPRQGEEPQPELPGWDDMVNR
jgi:hypothetical protein